MELYIITDTHIGHTNIVKLANRPVDFAEQILENWKTTVTPEDVVIHLGDVAWHAEALQKLSEMPGKKILVRGNHDTGSLLYYMRRGFDFACDRIAMTLYGIDVLFTHEPQIFHTHDINIHGHLHSLAKVDTPCVLYPMALEDQGYRPIPFKSIVKDITKLVNEHKNSGGWINAEND